MSFSLTDRGRKAFFYRKDRKIDNISKLGVLDVFFK